jgi:hypothetical protein
MPLWATLIVLGVVTSTGAGLLKTQLSIARELGTIGATLTSHDDRINDLEQSERHYQLDRDAELVAYRNGYVERPRLRWRT